MRTTREIIVGTSGMSTYRSWGHLPEIDQTARVPQWCSDTADLLDEKPLRGTSRLPFGAGRSYGDSCLNSRGELIDTRSLNRFIRFDREHGVLCAEPGVSLSQILALIVPAGWFLPVSPGTSHATLGGAIANDVHGKNHHRDGTFGRFVKSLRLARSDGGVVTCSSEENSELFAATIGGLGLTGLVTQATIQLIPITSSDMDVQVRLFRGLDEFLALSEQFKAECRYTVAWLDCAASGTEFARGVFLAANHAQGGVKEAADAGSKLGIPVALPNWTLNRWSVSAFNKLYFNRHRLLDGKRMRQHYQGFFYPLDAIHQWNRIYGSGGFYQYQFVVPLAARDALESILSRIVASGMGSFLAVLKQFGDITSPGMLSFPRPGLCLALDFANRGPRTETLLRELDDTVMAAGGAAYPAKDRLMRAEAFTRYFPRQAEFSAWVDPRFSSDFWRRVHG